MGGATEPVQHAGFGQGERAAADRHDASSPGVHLGQGVQHDRGQGTPTHVEPGHDDRVCVPDLRKPAFDGDGETARGGHPVGQPAHRQMVGSLRAGAEYLRRNGQDHGGDPVQRHDCYPVRGHGNI